MIYNFLNTAGDKDSFQQNMTSGTNLYNFDSSKIHGF